MFNIEITSIADNKSLFEKTKREERLILKSQEKELPIHEIIKLNNFFPSKSINNLITTYLSKGYTKKDIVKNPFLNDTSLLFLSRITDNEDNLEELLHDSITKKEAKNHDEKENTVLVIDNRTLIFEINDFYKVFNKIENLIQKSPFREIWLYTGYFSDDDGNNSEYSFAPMKITEKQKRVLDQLALKNIPNENGIIYT